MSNKQITAEQAEAIGNMAAGQMDIARRILVDNPNLHWLHGVAACALACRGLAEIQMRATPELTLDEARALMLGQFLQIMAMPPELVRSIETAHGDAPATIVIPVNKH